MTGPPEPRPTAAPRGLEAWLRRPSRLALLAAGFVALATAMTSIGSIERWQSLGFGPTAFDVLAEQALNWSLLVALAAPVGYAAVRFGRRARPWRSTLALLVATTAVVALLFVQQREAARWFGGFERPQRPQGERPFGGRERDPALRDGGSRPAAEEGEAAAPRTRREPTPEEREGAQQRRGNRGFGGGPRIDSFAWSLRFRLPRIILATWAFVGLGAAARLFLDAEERQREARRLELRAQALEGELAGAQLDALRAQLHPHFLFNALHSIGGLVRGGRGEDAVRTLDALGGLLRAGLEARGDGFVSLAEELALLERYLDVERVRLGARLRVEVEVPEALRDDDVPAFLLQPLVENAVRCAVAERGEGGRVRVSARVARGALEVDVEDDGPGYPERVLAGQGWGIGLTNVAARLATLFEGAGRLELGRSDLGGARARVTMPRDDDAPAEALG